MLEVYEVEAGRFGYRGPGILQEWHPEKEGFVAMTEQEATEMAAVIEARLAPAL